MEELYYPSADGKNNIHAVIWRPEGKIKGVVQIIHGMAEYAARYAPFAEFLNKSGYLVCAEDHLGHGLSVPDESKLGYFDENRDISTVISDIRALRDIVVKQTSGAPYFILGHSMGSFFCRKYISMYGGELSGAVIMGTGFKGSALMNFALFFTRLNAACFGWENRSRFIEDLAFGSYNKRFKGEGENAWLSKDAKNVSAYNEDGLCGFKFTDNGYYFLFSVIKAACNKKTIAAVPKDLPVRFVSGEDDPVGDYGKGVKKAFSKFKKAGVKDVGITLYSGARHEILNDTVGEKVMGDLLRFFDRHLAK